MVEYPGPQPEVTPVPADEAAPTSELLLDQFLPRSDVAVVHAGVFRARPEVCYRAARGVDLLQHPVIRTLLGLRALPQRAAARLTGRRATEERAPPPPTFRLDDMVGYGWVLLGEEPNVEVVLGQIGRPWKPVAVSAGPAVAPAAFAAFDRPGFAKIAVSLRVDPYGATSSILTLETRVALTDPGSRRRFRRYWLLIGPFSALIRRIALRQLAAELRRLAPTGAAVGTRAAREDPDVVRIHGEIVINRPVEEVFDIVADERNEPRYNPRMRRVEQVSEGPIGAGTRFRAETVSMGRSVEMVIEYTGYQRPRRLVSSTHMSAMEIQYTLTFEPVPEGTRMRWSGDLEPRGMLKLLRPLVARMGRRQEQRIWAGLKHLLEGQAS